jgi:hypothetical protein
MGFKIQFTMGFKIPYDTGITIKPFYERVIAFFNMEYFNLKKVMQSIGVLLTLSCNSELYLEQTKKRENNTELITMNCIWRKKKR